MSKWEGGMINHNVAYRTQTEQSAGGVYSLQNQLRHHAAGNWPVPFPGIGGNSGIRIPVTIIQASGNDNDSSADYSVYHNAAEFSAIEGGSTGRLYLSVLVSANPSYYNDFVVGAVQITSDDYTNLDKGWCFSRQGDNTWERASLTNIGVADTDGYENYFDIINVNSQSWDSIANSGASNGKWSRGTATGSNLTGATDGLDDKYSSEEEGNIIEGATSTVSQTLNTSYYFTETSGSNVFGKWMWIRSPEITLDVNDDKRLSVAYLAYTHSTQGMTDSAEAPLLRWWWVNA